MNVTTVATETGDLKVDFYEGPIMASVVLSIEDEEGIIQILKKGFADARRVIAGETVEEVADDNHRKAENEVTTQV